MKRRRLTRGTTLVEIMYASTLTTLVLVTAVGTFLLGMLSWVRGQGKIDAESSSQRAVREISNELREAMTVTVDANGLGLSYQLPQVDATGNYVLPATPDGVARRIALSGSTISITAPGVNRTVCKNVILTDPQSAGGTTPYVVFNPGTGTVTRSLNVMIVTKTTGYRTETPTSRSRETIYLRNIQSLTK